MSSLCVRCGSKEHTTREHDEGKINKGKGVGLKKEENRFFTEIRSERLVKAQKKLMDARVVHPSCWHATNGKINAIPDVIDPFFQLHSMQKKEYGQCVVHWEKRSNCPCLKCKKAKEKLALNALRRVGKA